MPATSFHRRSPVPGLGLDGYTDELTVPAGGRVRAMVGGPPGTAQVALARLIHGDPNPAGPGWREEPVAWGQPASLEIRNQPIDFGSYVEAPHSASLNPTGGFTLALWFYPTLVDGGWHTLAAKWDVGNLGYALYVTGNRLLTAAISLDGVTAQWAAARDFAQLKMWQFAAVTFDPDLGRLCLYQYLPAATNPLDSGSTGTGALVAAAKDVRAPAGRIYAGQAPLLFAATSDPEAPGMHWAHYNGKIGHPVLFGEALDAQRLHALAGGEPAANLGPVLGAWDFSLEVQGQRVVDTSPNGNHGRTVNAPGRAVTGPGWSGSLSRRYTERPGLYNAIHFHDDDLDDAGWPPALEINVPAEAKPGIYAARLERGADRLYLPFIVRPAAPRAPLAFLAPTLTWQAYSSNRAPFSSTEDGMLDTGLNLYDVHRDGSMVYYTSRHRPTRSWTPGEGTRLWGAHTITSELYTVDWLEAKGFDYDLFADQDLDREGTELLSGYRCLILGSHPEYYTKRMMVAVADYVRQGGRVLYLGGNGLYWVTSIDPERPHLIEVRKSGEGDYGPAYVPEPGEIQHNTTLEVGGLWMRRGLPARSIVGVEFASNVFQSAEGRWGFRRLPASHDPRYAFVFEGIGPDEVIGDFGLNLGSAVGFEMDAVQDWPWDAITPEPVRLATVQHEDFYPPARVPVAPAADIALTVLPGGGAVFAAASVTWSGSLSHNRYDNNVSRITENALRRFLNTPAGESVLKEVDTIAKKNETADERR